ncbi:MAG: TetR/AcrR family transcriptional regulator [Jiangellaceae bacterium]
MINEKFTARRPLGVTAAPIENAQPERALPTRRERTRAATIDEIKGIALRLMHEQGTTDVRFSDIAREMGMTAPALYRYFADRDELLTAMIVDAFDDLGAVVAAARDDVPVGDPTGRLFAVAQAYRSWAHSEPQRFALILGMPVPGYAAPEEGPTTEAARRAMFQLKSLFFDAADQGVLRPPLLRYVHESLRTCFDAEAATKPSGEPALPADTFQACLHSWAALHGFTCLEAYGHLDFLPPEARDALFASTIRLVATTAGLPLPASA